MKKIMYMAVVLFSACSLPKNTTEKLSTAVPAKYNATANDTATIATINWRKYFSDEQLLKLIDTALALNPDMQIALQHIEVARSGVRFAAGNLFPTIAAKGSAGRTDYAQYTQEYAGNITTYYEPNKIVPNPLNDFYVGLTAAWEMDIWGKLRNQRKAALSNYLASIEGKNFVVSNLIAEIATAYYELIALDNELEIIRQTIQKQQEALDAVKWQKEAARANELAVQQFEAQLLNTQALEKETAQQITETENKINFLAGRFPQTIERKKELLFQEMPQQITSGIPAQLLSHRPDIREAELQVKASKYDLKAARAAFFPNINISAALGFQSFNTQYLFVTPASVASNILGGLAAPLINRNAIKAQFNTASANQLAAMYNYQKTILNGYTEVANGLSNIENLKQISTLKKQQTEVVTQSVETSTELYKASKANYLEVLIAQQNSLQTQIELINTNKRLHIATVTIYKALGGGWK